MYRIAGGEKRGRKHEEEVKCRNQQSYTELAGKGGRAGLLASESLAWRRSQGQGETRGARIWTGWRRGIRSLTSRALEDASVKFTYMIRETKVPTRLTAMGMRRVEKA